MGLINLLGIYNIPRIYEKRSEKDVICVLKRRVKYDRVRIVRIEKCLKIINNIGVSPDNSKKLGDYV